MDAMWIFYVGLAIALMWLISAWKKHRAKRKANPASKVKKDVGWKGLIAAAGICMMLIVIAVNQISGQSSDDQEAGALLHCQIAIRRASLNGAQAVVPKVRNVYPATEGQYAFDWKGGSGLQLQNGYGAMVDTYATCLVSKKDLEIDRLLIGSDTVISRSKQ